MKLYKFTCGADEKIGVFADEKEANSRRAEVDPTFQYVHTTIEEVRIPGYNITITPIGKTAAVDAENDDTPPADPDQFDDMDRDTVKAWLDDNHVEYTSNWGDKRLRETARAWLAAQPPKTEEDDNPKDDTSSMD